MDVRALIGDILEHHGVKGMHWGQRKSAGKVSDTKVGGKKTKVTLAVTKEGKVVKAKGGENSPTSHDSAKATAYSQTAKKSGTQALSNAELQHLVNRMNLEQNYSRVSNAKSGPAKKGSKFVGSMLSSIGKQEANNLTRTVIATQIAKAIAKKAAKTTFMVVA